MQKTKQAQVSTQAESDTDVVDLRNEELDEQTEEVLDEIDAILDENSQENQERQEREIRARMVRNNFESTRMYLDRLWRLVAEANAVSAALGEEVSSVYREIVTEYTPCGC